MDLKTALNPTESEPTQAAAHDLLAFAQLVRPPALSCGESIKLTIRYSCALSADLRVFVLALAGERSFIGFNPVQNAKMGNPRGRSARFQCGLINAR
jgi:hypothetical protein